MIVYCFTNVVNGKVYVGITDKPMEDRWYKHQTSARNGSEYHFHRAIRKHGVEAFEGLILEECETSDELKNAEKRWIWLLASNLSSHGYNMTLGGDGIFGLKMTAESRQRMSDAHKGRRHTFERRQKIREAMVRRYEDPAERQRTRDSLLREDVRRKMSENGKGKGARGRVNKEPNNGTIESPHTV